MPASGYRGGLLLYLRVKMSTSRIAHFLAYQIWHTWMKKLFFLVHMVGAWINPPAICLLLGCGLQKSLESEFLSMLESGWSLSRQPGSSCPLEEWYMPLWWQCLPEPKWGVPFRRGSVAGRTAGQLSCQGLEDFSPAWQNCVRYITSFQL